MKKRGKLIVICGIDGSGKSTLEAGLVDALRLRGRDVHVTKQPTDFYRTHPDVRQYLQTGTSALSVNTIALIAAMDRMIHIEKEIAPQVAQGKWVVSNRYVFSTFAYFECRGADMQFVRAINSQVPLPDFGFLITLPAAIAVSRIRARDGNRFKYEERDESYLERAQNLLSAAVPSTFCRLDGTEPPHRLLAQAKDYLGLS